MPFVRALAIAAVCLALPACKLASKTDRPPQLTIDVGDGGEVAKSPEPLTCTGCPAGALSYGFGTRVALTATPHDGYAFAGWTGACSGDGACALTMDRDQAVGARFSRLTAQLEVRQAGDGAGTIASEPAGIDCGGVCTASFPLGATATLRARPDDNSAFAGWSGACQGDGPCNVLVDVAKSVTATFVARRASLAVERTGPGTVVSQPAGIYCGAACASGFAAGAAVALVAQPDSSATFTGWGGACSGTGPCVVTLQHAARVTAGFTRAAFSVSVSRTGDGAGTVSAGPAGIDCGSTCSAAYDQGTLVVLSATPDALSTFAGWSGDCSGAGACVIPVDGIKSVSASFTRQRFPFTVATAGDGAGTVAGDAGGIACGAACSAALPSGSTIHLTATPAAGSSFAGWSGACSGTGPCAVTLTAAASVTATFSTSRLSLTASAGPGGTIVSQPAGIYCGAQCNATFPQGTSVALTAVPTGTAAFAGWSGACSGTGACSVTIDSARTVGASFTNALTLARTGQGAGTITSSPAGINCGSACSAAFSPAGEVALTATPDASSIFVGWSGACSGAGACSVSMDRARSVSANFAPRPITLSVRVLGPGAVSSQPAGIDCGATCSGSFDNGAQVVLTAQPATGAAFAGFTGGGCTASPCTVTLASATTVTATFTAPPHAQITYGPANPTRLANATLWFTSTPAAPGFLCTLDQAAAAPCSSPQSYTALADGPHTFTVQAVDGGGTPEEPGASLSWSVLTAPPTTSITLRPPDPSNSTTPQFQFSSTAPGSTFACRVDQGPFVRCASPYTLPAALGEGQHGFTAIATDAAGNSDPQPPTATWRVDLTPPRTTLTGNPPALSNLASPQFRFTANEPSTFKCTVDSAAPVACSSPFTPPAALADGPHSFSVAATDQATNQETSPPTYSWAIDTVKPVITNLTIAPAYAKAGARITIAFSVSEPVSDPVVKLFDSAPGRPFDTASKSSQSGNDYTYVFTPAGNEAQGATRVTIDATDPSTNVGSAATSSLLTLDFAAPGFAVTAAPARLKMGASYVVTVAANEALKAAPSVTVAGHSLGSPTGNTGNTYTYQATVQSGDTEGAQAIAVSAADLANNTGNGSGSVYYDYHVDYDRTKITLVRTPVGAAKSIAAIAGATEPNASVLVYSDQALANQVGAATADGAGAFNAPIGTTDLQTAYLQVTDVATNQSAAFQPGLVRQTVNYAGASSGAVAHTASYRLRGDELAPPSATPAGGSDGAAFSTADYDAVSSIDSARVQSTRSPSPLGWRGVKPALGNTAGTFDYLAGQAQLFISTFPEKTSWAWNGTGFRFLGTPSSPDWNGYVMSWDGVNQKPFLWAGSSCCGSIIATSYLWDGKRWNALAPNNSPSMRQSPSLAWDPARKKLVMYGGGPAETWEWNGADWTNKSPASGNPPAVNNAPMAYDGKGGFTLLQWQGKSWRWDGATWADITPAGAVPSGNSGDLMAYDSLRQKTVLLTGTTTWEWDGAAWTKNTAATLPHGAQSGAMIFDPVRGNIYLATGYAGDHYTYDGTAWTLVSARPPDSRAYQSMAYDQARGRSVLFGGQYASNDTWEWTGTDWTKAQNGGTASATLPGQRYNFSMAAGGGATLIMGGASNQSNGLSDTYSWNGTAWAQITGSTPGARSNASMAYDPDRSKFVLFSGAVSAGSVADTWLFDGAAWAKQTLALSPAPRSAAGLAFFPPRHTTVLQGTANDTWEWNGSAWAQWTPLGNGPFVTPASYAQRMVYDPTRARLIFIDQGNKTLEWDGGRWRATPAPPPGRSDGCGLSYHAAQSQAVMFCGAGSYSPGYPTGDTWVYDPPLFAGQIYNLHVDATNPTQLSLVAVAGGAGDDGTGLARNGARVLAWNAARSLWAELGANTAADADPQAARTLTIGNIANAAEYVSGGIVTLLVLPAGPAGVQPLQLSADYLEATVTYPIP